MACQTCRLRKVKCTRERPECRNCATRSLTCIYQGERIKRRKLNKATNTSQLNPTPQRTSLPHLVAEVSVSGRTSDSHSLRNGVSECGASIVEPTGSYMSPISTNDCIAVEHIQVNNRDPQSSTSEDLLDRILAHDPQRLPANRSPSVWIRTDVGDEYTGPSSGISVISDQGLSWIKGKVEGCGCLCDTFKQFRSTLVNHLRNPKCITLNLQSTFEAHVPRKDLPCWTTIQEWVEAYFCQVQVHFPVLNRERFEAQLLAFKSGRAKDCPSWTALLYAVLASGCRAAFSDETAAAFQTSANEAWSYFISALSYEQVLVHAATDLTAVQSLAVMTVFAQGMSSPQRLEFTLCSTAVRLAFSLAMNRSPPVQWNLEEAEVEERNRTFWVVYSLDKTLALRCGRPSGIDDAEISCEFPRVKADFSTTSASDSGFERHSFDFFLCVVRYARICSRISRGLYSAEALSKCCFDLKNQAVRLLIDIQAWRASIPETTRSRVQNSAPGITHDMSKPQLVFLQLSYYYALCSVYRRFGSIFCQTDESEDELEDLLQGAIATSQLEAARSMVLLTKHIDVESYSPGWLVFYQPMTALITIFLHVICNPTDKDAAHDIALMEVAVGFFGRLEYVTVGEAGFTQVTEFVRQARFKVNKSGQDSCHCGSSIRHTTQTLSPPREPADAYIGSTDSRTTEPTSSEGVSGELFNRVDENHQLDMSNRDAAREAFDFDARKTPRPGPRCNLDQPDDQTSDGVMEQFGAASYDPWADAWFSQPELLLSGILQTPYDHNDAVTLPS